ncbi:MAG: polysaccharide biosynthesis/export family protein [Bacteroidia bacterium]|jgi:polysaccharide export outer membrane protein|nr:polysaccharide biosynthesis/export family protein [Bacteroidia bacterium]
MRYILIFLALGVVLSSCKVMRSNLMLKTPKDYKYDELVDSLAQKDYRVAPNDEILYFVFTNDGFKLIDLATQVNTGFKASINTIVESDGMIKMPLVGRVFVEGLTIKELQLLLEEKYAEFYVKPYVEVRVSNKRIIVFPGSGGSAKVLPLTNNNTTVMEALAAAGGIVEDGKAYKVKLIRNSKKVGGKPLVYLMDLSTIDGLSAANSIVQANDIIYVEPRYKPLATFNKEVLPLVTTITGVILIIQLFRSL